MIIFYHIITLILLLVSSKGIAQKDSIHPISNNNRVDSTNQYKMTKSKQNILSGCIFIPNIYFDKKQFYIRKDELDKLDRIVVAMKEYSTMVLELIAHTDCRGRESKNTILSEKRAKAIIQYLTDRGVDKSRLSFKAFGETRLVNACDCKSRSLCFEKGHGPNNRVEFIILKM